MRSKNNAPTPAQRDYWADLVELDCIVKETHAEIHHVVGASAKHNGISIGNWFVLAISPEIHRLGVPNLTLSRYAFYEMYGSKASQRVQLGCEIEMFFLQCRKYMMYYNKPLPFDGEVMSAILSYRK